MAVNIRGRSFLKLLDYTPAEIRYLLDLSRNFKDMKRAGVPHRWLEGKNIVLLFEKTSTRTRCSFEVAGMDLGMGVTYLEPGSSQMGKLWDKDCFLYCLIRLGLIPAAVLLGCRLCGAESLVTGVSVVLAAMPMGGVTAVLAEKYGGDSAFASKCVAVSTVLSLITTPLWCMVV